jgi:DNA-directed RNA polymerase subunit RPC12/RpoP
MQHMAYAEWREKQAAVMSHLLEKTTDIRCRTNWSSNVRLTLIWGPFGYWGNPEWTRVYACLFCQQQHRAKEHFYYSSGDTYICNRCWSHILEEKEKQGLLNRSPHSRRYPFTCQGGCYVKEWIYKRKCDDLVKLAGGGV